MRREKNTLDSADRLEASPATQDLSSERPLRLLYVTASAVEEGTPVYTHVTAIVDGLRSLGWLVELQSPRGTRLGTVGQQFRRLFEVVWIQLSALRGLKSCDALYCRLHFALWPLAIAARLKGVPVFHEINGPYDEFFIAHPYMWWARRPAVMLMRAQMRSADLLLTITEGLKSWICGEVDARRVEVVGNGADTHLFRPGLESDFSVPKPYAVFFGSLARWQGIDTLLSAVEGPAWPEGLHLAIAGDGACRRDVEAAATRSHRISYLGPIPHRKVPGLVAESMAGLSPQNSVGNRVNNATLKLYETLASGVPVVSSDTPAHRDTVLENACGLLVPMEDPEGLGRALKYLMDNPDAAREMGRRARVFVEREASWDRRAGQVDALLRATIGLSRTA